MVEIEKIEELKELLDEGKNDVLLRHLLNLQHVEIAEFLSQIDIEKVILLFKKIPEDIRGDVFCELNLTYQNNIYNSLSPKEFAKIFSSMPSEYRVDFYKQLDAKNQVKILPFLSKNVRYDVISLSLYKDNTAGGIMSTEFVTLYKEMTVQEACDKIYTQKIIYCAYVVDCDMKMIGFVLLRDLIFADKKQYISDILHDKYIHALVDDDREKVASMIGEYSLIAIPILNNEKQLVGIVKYDDAINVIKKEQTEDIEKLMGIISDNKDKEYLEISCYQNYVKRIGWIICLFFLGILTTVVLNHYELLLKKIPILIPFFPMISAVGGNTGTQTASVIIRSLSIGEIRINNFLGVILKELKISLLMSTTLFFFVYLEALIILYLSKDNTYNPFWISFVISISLFLQVVVAMVIGTILPMVVKFFKKDPAVVASPAITTIVDVTGIIIYFTIAMAML